MSIKNKENFKFAWRVVAAHVIAYFIAGIFAMNMFNYQELFINGTLSLFMRPTTAPIVILGPCLQIIRGIIMALVLLPIRKVFTEEKYGFLKLGVLILGLSVLSTFAAAFGSVDGFIYTKLSLMEQIIGYPEAIVWIFLFTGILWILYKFEKKAISIITIVLLILIVLMSTAGYLTTVLTVQP
jgi:hypothetical protein